MSLTVVTGSTGHVGNNLIRALLKEGRTVRALMHGPENSVANLPIEKFYGDIRNPEDVSRLIDGADTVFHLAALISLVDSDWPLMQQINIGGVANITQACLTHNVKRLVHFSSIHAHQLEPATQPVDENRALHPLDAPVPPYDRTKAEGERTVRQAIANGLDAIIINPVGVIGPNDYGPSHMGTFFLQIAHKKLPASVAGGFNWVDVRDLVALALKAEKEAPTGSKYLVAGHWASSNEIAHMIANFLSVPPPKKELPQWVARAAVPLIMLQAKLTGKRPLFTQASIDALSSYPLISHAKATAELGYQPRPIQETIEDTIRWFQENGMIAS